MREIEILLPPAVAPDAVTRAIDASVAECGLTVTLRDSLKKFPGCVHWHLKRGLEPGTLEVTLWPSQHRAWLSVQKGRAAPWIEVELKRLDDALQRRLLNP